MPAILTDRLLPALSWTFFHSLWQGLALTVLAGLVMLLTRRAAATLRYSLLCTLFFGFLGGVVISFLAEWKAAGQLSASVLPTSDTTGRFSEPSALAQWMREASAFLDRSAQWIVMIWMSVLLFKAGRMLLDMLVLRRLRSYGTLPPSASWSGRVQALSQQLGINRKVALMESALVKVPIVIGHFKPLILVPAGLLSQMPAGELEAVLLHELAHIRRHDFLVNFIQRLSELVFFFNPGLLWVSSLLRIEREHCCDDMAIAQTNNKVQFVEALIYCKERSLAAPGYALGLFGKKNQLLQRLTRIAYNNNKSLSALEAGFFILNLVVLSVLLSAMRVAENVTRPVDPLPSAQTSSSIAKPFDPVPEPIPMVKKGTAKSSKRPVKPSVSGRIPVTPALPVTQRITQSTTTTETRTEIKDYADNYSRYLSASHTYQQVIKVTVSQQQRDAAAIRLQADQDRKQADQDRKQADRDRIQAQRDREQAERDREQAAKDRVQAAKDREQAEKDRAQAEKDRVAARIGS